MATLSTVISYGEPTGTIVTEIGTPGPTGQTGPQGPAGPTFTGGPITSAITYTSGNISTVFENGDIYTEENTSGAYGVVYINGLEASDGTNTITMSSSGIQFPDSTVQSTGFPGSSAFYPSTGNPSGFLTAASLSGYATQSWVTSQGYATQSYVNGQGFITASALTPYLLSSTAASTYQTISGMSAYLSKAGNLSGLSNTATARTNLGLGTMATQTASNYLTVSAAAAGYYPLSGNPSAFLTDAPSDGSQYARQDGAWSVVTGGGGGSYLPLAGGTMTGAIVFDGTSGQYISKGNFDTSRGGNYGISLVCSIGYEFNWQAGWLTTTQQGNTTPRPLYLDSLAGTTLRAWDSATDTGVEIAHTGITFPDSSVQSSAANPFNGGTIVGAIDWNDGGNNQTAQVGLQGFVVTNQFDFDYQVTIGGDTWRGIAVYNYNGDVGLSINQTGITFPDSTVQSSAAFVPGSGNLDMAGYDITNANFNSSAGQVSAQNVTLSSGGSITFGDSTVQTTAYTGGGGGGLPAVQIAASAINPNYISTGANFPPLTYPTHTDILNGTYATAITYSNDGVGNPALILSGLTALNSAYVYNNPSMTSAPDFTGLTSLSTAQVSGNTSMTSAPSFSGLTSLYTADVNSNALMISAPSFSGCTSLNTANVISNTSMTSAPDFSGCTSLNTANVYYNNSMTSAPSFSGCTSLNTANVNNNVSMTSAPDFTTITQSGIQIYLNNCAISDCTTPLDQLNAGGGYSGFIDLSGGSNQSIDPTYYSLLSLQSKGWTVIFNSL